ncbi:glycoside hydrolase family 15 protein [Pseudoalteromonas sp. MMG012]|uniref:glycoside hydrolase family 15 protein n=1 Tax=Pseudoalteromonas sp. MMG012 TaxID=2822686 RepID=UPI001B39E7F1|nr:glycoside hydrolase family 15 protein [Pseudoalteromonas sp. MMG012]MBQ4849743.1 glucan 1,4-alpha-glucosidase [Pseudoalteromonas sp. MMG012]
MKQFSKRAIAIVTSAMLAGGLVGCQHADNQLTTQNVAPGAPGDTPYWAYAGKTGIGTSYEAYLDGQYSDSAATTEVSKVWFSIAQGMITETMFGLIHQAQLKDMQFIVTGIDSSGTAFTVQESHVDELDVSVDYLYKDAQGRPLSLAYKITSVDKQGRFTLEKHVFTDSEGQSLFVRGIIKTHLSKLHAYVSANPYINNNGVGDSAKVTEHGLVAFEGEHYLTLQAKNGFRAASVGFTGQSDNLRALQQQQKMAQTYTSTGALSGNVSMLADLGAVENTATFDLVLSFADSQTASATQAKQTLSKGYQAVLDTYNGMGNAIGWEDYIASLSPITRLSNFSADKGKLLYTSALVLKAQEDKTHAGALIASLSNPWGDTVPAIKGHTGYKAVWVRDFYQVAMAFMAMGDADTAKTAFEYLEKVQVSAQTPGNQGDIGWFLQKTHVDGVLEWVGVQLDQTAMPIMLAWKLHQANVLSDEELQYWYKKMLKPAAEFLVEGGKAKILWNDTQITPPATQQERWEEQSGYSPSTTAAIISGLVTASDIAKRSGDMAAAQRYLETARKYDMQVESLMFTHEGVLAEQGNSQASDGQYFFRIGQDSNPSSNSKINTNNGRAGMNKKAIIDGGFLELVRYGVRSADAPSIVATLPEYDDETMIDELRVKYSFTFEGESGTYPGYRRYGNDGYGEDKISGTNYAESGKNTAGQRGRVWPFFTGERGHYDIALAVQNNTFNTKTADKIKHTYVKGMELFANEGMMLPEQVWDNVGVNPHGYKFGEGTNSATPLAWTHAEYIKLVRSLADKQVWDHYPLVSEQLK